MTRCDTSTLLDDDLALLVGDIKLIYFAEQTLRNQIELACLFT